MSPLTFLGWGSSRLTGPSQEPAPGALPVERAPAARDAALSPGVVDVTGAFKPRWRNGIDALLDVLPDADDALAEEGDGVYVRMEADPDLAAALDQLDRRVLGRELEWKPPHGMEGDDRAREAADYVAAVCRGQLDVRADLAHLFRAKSRRLAVSQVEWERGTGRYGEPPGTWVPRRMRAEDGRHFGLTGRDRELYSRGVLGYGGRPVLLTRGRYARRFVYHAHGVEPERPRGSSLLDRAYWPWKMLKAFEGYWLDAGDRYAVPPVAALVEGLVGDFNDDKVVERARALLALMAENVAALGSGTSGALVASDVKTITPNGTGFGFVDATNYLRERMRIAVLGTTLTVATQGQGARAHGEVHADEVDGLARWYAADLARTAERTLGRWIAQERFGPDVPFPRAAFDFRQTATLDETLKAAEAGLPVSLSAFYTGYNIPEPSDEADEFVAVRATGTPAKSEDDEGLSFSDRGRGPNADPPFGRARAARGRQRSPTGPHRRTTTPTN